MSLLSLYKSPIDPSIFHTVDSDRPIAMIPRGGADGTRMNHEKQKTQRQLDVHGQRECRWQDDLFFSVSEITVRRLEPFSADSDHQELTRFYGRIFSVQPIFGPTHSRGLPNLNENQIII
jgi:hypothetical protein